MAENKVKLVPEIRFKGFTDAWVQRKLGDVAESFEYGLNVAATDFDGINKYIRITDIDDNSREFKVENITSPDCDLSAADNYRLQIGDILFARTGASVGKTYRYAVKDGLVYFAGFLIRARLKDEFDTEFVYQNTLTRKYINFIKTTSQRSGQPGVNAQEYAGFSLSVPSANEQSKIGAFFSTFDNTITLYKRKLECLQMLKEGYLQLMFPQTGEHKPRLRFSEFTDPWEQRQLGEIAEFSKGSGYSKGDLTSTGMPIILYGRLYTKYETIIEDVDTFVEPRVGSVLSQGSEIIVPSSGETAEDISRASVVSKQGVILGGDLNIIRANAIIDPVFLAITISNGNQQKELSKRAQGKSVVHINNSDLKEVALQHPSHKEQTTISTFFRTLENTITLHKDKLECLQKLKKGYLQKVFP